jgi:phospholipid N-methyltransferase
MELFVLMGISIYGVGLLFSAIKGAPYVPTSNKQFEKIFKNVKLKKGEILIELGSGDGRLTRYAAKTFGIEGVGIEINPLLIWWSRFLSQKDGTKKSVQFLRKNIFDYPLNHADYLYLFLMPDLIIKLLPKFSKELKKGVIIISHGFKIIGYEKKLVHTEFDKMFSTYYYKV